jgi:hypothetical protein
LAPTASAMVARELAASFAGEFIPEIGNQRIRFMDKHLATNQRRSATAAVVHRLICSWRMVAFKTGN